MCSVLAGLMALTGFVQYRNQQNQIKAQANAQARMYEQQARAAEQNARIENRKQEQIADNYAVQANKLRERQRLAEGAQRAETGAAGLGFSGSAMDILSSNYQAYSGDQQNLLWNQRNDNYNSRVAETSYLTQASDARSAASNVQAEAKRAQRGNLFGSILGTATGIALANPGNVFGGAAENTGVQAGHLKQALSKTPTGGWMYTSGSTTPTLTQWTSNQVNALTRAVKATPTGGWMYTKSNTSPTWMSFGGK